MSRFDLEEAIMNCWQTSEDLKLLIENISEDKIDSSQVSDFLVGIERLHNMRTQKVFDIFENLIKQRKIV